MAEQVRFSFFKLLDHLEAQRNISCFKKKEAKKKTKTLFILRYVEKSWIINLNDGFEDPMKIILVTSFIRFKNIHSVPKIYSIRDEIFINDRMLLLYFKLQSIYYINIENGKTFFLSSDNGNSQIVLDDYLFLGFSL